MWGHMAKKSTSYFVLLSALGVLSSACSTVMGPKYPDLMPNEQYTKAGSAQADADVRYCMSQADMYVKQSGKTSATDVATTTVGGAAVGAGAGALGGAIMGGKVGRATAAGATIGAIAGLASEGSKVGEHSEYYERFVENCLSKKGYAVVGWSHR